MSHDVGRAPTDAELRAAFKWLRMTCSSFESAMSCHWRAAIIRCAADGLARSRERLERTEHYRREYGQE